MHINTSIFAIDVPKAQEIPKKRLPDTKFETDVGWVPELSLIHI